MPRVGEKGAKQSPLPAVDRHMITRGWMLISWSPHTIAPRLSSNWLRQNMSSPTLALSFIRSECWSRKLSGCVYRPRQHCNYRIFFGFGRRRHATSITVRSCSTHALVHWHCHLGHSDKSHYIPNESFLTYVSWENKALKQQYRAKTVTRHTSAQQRVPRTLLSSSVAALDCLSR